MISMTSAKSASWVGTTFLACTLAIAGCNDDAPSTGSGGSSGDAAGHNSQGASAGTVGSLAGSAGVAGAAGAAGDEEAAGTAGASYGSGGTVAGAGGTDAGTGGSTAGAGGTIVGTGGGSGGSTAGAGGTTAGAGGTTAGAGGTAAGAGGAAGSGGSHVTTACGSPSVAALNSAGSWPSGTTELADLGITYQWALYPAFHSGDRVVATGTTGQGWVLWNSTEGTQVAKGSGYLFDLRGPVFLVGSVLADYATPPTKFEIRASSDGHVLGTINNTSYAAFGLASDGSYVWGTDPTNKVLSVWSPAGVLTQSFSTVSFNTLSFSAAPGKLTLAGSDAHLHFLNSSDGTQTTSSASFSGTFVSVFVDGSHFITETSALFGPVVQVYTPNVSLVATISLSAREPLGGQGNYLWVHSVGTSEAYPIQDATFPSPAFSWTTPTVTYVYGSANPHSEASAFNAELAAKGSPDASGDYCSAGPDGVLHFGNYGNALPIGTLGCGKALAVAGSESGTVAVATASGQVLLFDTASNQLSESFQVGIVSHLTLAADGKTLGVLVNDGSSATNADGSSAKKQIKFDVYALPGGHLIKSWADNPQWVRLSRSGTTLTSGCATSDLSGANSNPLVLPSSVRCEMVPISPGNQLASNTEDPHFDSVLSVSPNPPATYFYSATTPVASATGYAVGWLDDNRLLVENYSLVKFQHQTIWQYNSSSLYDKQGSLLGLVPSLPVMTDFYTVSPSQILSYDDGNIYDLSTGSIVWASHGYPAAAAGSRIAWDERGGRLRRDTLMSVTRCELSVTLSGACPLPQSAGPEVERSGPVPHHSACGVHTGRFEELRLRSQPTEWGHRPVHAPPRTPAPPQTESSPIRLLGHPLPPTAVIDEFQRSRYPDADDRLIGDLVPRKHVANVTAAPSPS